MSSLAGRQLSDEIQVVRQPIFDASGAVTAYQLITRTETLLDVFSSLDESSAAAKLLSDTFLEMDVWSLTGGLPAYLRLPAELLLGGVPTALPADRTVLQLSDDAIPTPELIAVCKKFQAAGYALAIGGLSDTNPQDALREIVDVVKIDLRRTTPVFQQRVIAEARRAGRRVVAENVDTRLQETTARLLGYQAFQGRFFQQPSTVRRVRLNGSRAAYLQLLNVVNAPDIDYDEVADVIKRDVSLAWKFLNYINASFFGWRRRIESINNGLVLLGQSGVRRWVSLMVVSEMASDAPQALTVDAISRARMCERIAERLPQVPGPDGISLLGGFLAGMFSLLDAMIDEPLEDILTQVVLPDEVVAAILHGEGQLGSLLGLVVAYERGAWDTVEDRAAALGIPTATLTSIYLDALAWAHATLAGPDLESSASAPAGGAGVGAGR